MPTMKTIYCGRRHRLADGVPVAHACRVLDPAYLRAERGEDYDTAARLMLQMAVTLHDGLVTDELGDRLR